MSLAPADRPRADATTQTVATPVWAAGGHSFRIVGEAGLVETASRTFTDLPPATVAGVVHDYLVETSAEGYLVVGRRPPLERECLAACLDTLQWLVNQRVIEELTGHETGVHAACAQRGDDVVLIAGPSGAGKSTVVAGLVRAGCDYLTDETALVDDETLSVRPYSKPITIDRGAWPLFPETADLPRSDESCLVPVGHLGGSVGTGGRIEAVVCLTFSAGRATQLEPMTPAEVVMALATSTFEFSSAGQRHLAVLARLARSVPGHRLVAGDLQGAVDAVGSLMGIGS